MRDIKVSSIKSFTKFGWEIVPNSEGTQVAAKKKDVEPVESKITVTPSDGEGFTITSLEGAELSESSTESAGQAEIVMEQIPAIESLRDEFETITGKVADKRWSLKRISEELDKLK